MDTCGTSPETRDRAETRDGIAGSAGGAGVPNGSGATGVVSGSTTGAGQYAVSCSSCQAARSACGASGAGSARGAVSTSGAGAPKSGASNRGAGVDGTAGAGSTGSTRGGKSATGGSTINGSGVGAVTASPADCRDSDTCWRSSSRNSRRDSRRSGGVAPLVFSWLKTAPYLVQQPPSLARLLCRCAVQSPGPAAKLPLRRLDPPHCGDCEWTGPSPTGTAAQTP